MKKMTNSLVIGSVLAASSLVSGSAMAELGGNIGVTSNYLWRGMTQTNDTSAVSGGLDYSNGDFYLGTWTSNLGGGDYELDLYGGFGLTTGSVELDLGFIRYEYPVSETNFSEVYANASLDMFSLGVAYTVSSDDDDTAEYSSGDLYYSVGATFEVSKGVEGGITFGSYDYEDDAGDDFTHFQVSVSKDDFTFAVDKNDREGTGEDLMRVSASWSKSFDM